MADQNFSKGGRRCAYRSRGGCSWTTIMVLGEEITGAGGVEEGRSAQKVGEAGGVGVELRSLRSDIVPWCSGTMKA